MASPPTVHFAGAALAPVVESQQNRQKVLPSQARTVSGVGRPQGCILWTRSVYPKPPQNQRMCLYSARSGQREEKPHPSSWAPAQGVCRTWGGQTGRVPDMGSPVSSIQICQLLEEGLVPTGAQRGVILSINPHRLLCQGAGFLSSPVSQTCGVQTLEPDGHRANPSSTAFRLRGPKQVASLSLFPHLCSRVPATCPEGLS